MARAKYYIKRQFQGDKAEEIADYTRKDKAEKYLNLLFKDLGSMACNSAYWVRTGYFKVDNVSMLGIVTTEYWIEKY